LVSEDSIAAYIERIERREREERVDIHIPIPVQRYHWWEIM